MLGVGYLLGLFFPVISADEIHQWRSLNLKKGPFSALEELLSGKTRLVLQEREVRPRRASK